MASPKFDAIQIELSRRLGDPVSAVANDGTWLTAAVRTAYTNKALHKFFSDMVMAVQGDKMKLAQIFPELLSAPTELTLTSGNYNIDTGSQNIKDIWRIYNGYVKTSNYYIRPLDESLYSVMITGINKDYISSASNPAVIQVGRILYFFPLSSSFTPVIIYLKLPLNPTDGSLLTANGTYDSPFGYQWQSQIASIAQQLFLIDHQKGN